MERTPARGGRVEDGGEVVRDRGAAFERTPERWRAVGLSGPVALLVALDGERGSHMVAVDHRRKGAPTLELVALERRVVHSPPRASGSEFHATLAVHSPSGELLASRRIDVREPPTDLRGGVVAPVATGRWRAQIHRADAVLLDPRTVTLTDALTGGDPPAPSVV